MAECTHLDQIKVLQPSDEVTGWCAGAGVETDAAGHILTGPDLLREGRRPAGWPLDRDPLAEEASTPGMFAADDVQVRLDQARCRRRGRRRGLRGAGVPPAHGAGGHGLNLVEAQTGDPRIPSFSADAV